MNNKKTRMISFNELWWNIVRDWIVILSISFICAIVLGGLSYWKSSKENKAAYESELQKNSYEQSMTEDEIAMTDSVAELYTNVEKSKIEYSNGYFANIDSSSVSKVILYYYVNSKETDPDLRIEKGQTLISAYAFYLKDVEFVNGIVGLVDDVYASDVPYMAPATSEHEVMCIVLKAQNEKDAGKLADYTKDKLVEFSSVLSSSVGNHDLILYGESKFQGADSDLGTIQSQRYVEYNTQLEDIKNTAKTLNYKQLVLLEKKCGKSVEEMFDFTMESLGYSSDNNKQILMTKPKVSKKFVVLGLVLGLMLGVFVSVCKLLLSGKVRSISELEDIYDIKVLGLITEKKCNALKKDVLENLYGEVYSEEDTIVAEKIRIISAKNNCDNVSLVSLYNNSICNRVMDSFAKNGTNKDVTINYIDNTDQVALAKASSVLLVEKVGKTKKNDVEKIMKMAQMYETNVLGIILFV